MARKDLVILQEEKQRSDSRNTIVTIALPPLPPPSPLPSPLLSQLPSQLPSPPPTPEPLESEIPAKHLDHKPKALDPPDLTEPKPNT
jgi:hypothetical protein